MNSINQKIPLEVAKNLKLYQEGGIIRYDKVLSIPLADRLPSLVNQYGEKKIHGIITVMLTEFCHSFNVVRPMTSEQIIQCAYEIIISSEEDYLSIEDVAIFFQGAKQGKYGKPVFDHLDQQVIFVMFEAYREIRHQEYMRIKEEKEVVLKSSGTLTRLNDQMNPQDIRLSKSTDNLAGAIGDLKNRFKEWKDEGK